jgi:hypothetical protein
MSVIVSADKATVPADIWPPDVDLPASEQR